MSLLNPSTRPALLALLLSTAASPALAQDYLSLSLEELLQVRVTAATRTEESLRSVPASVTVFSRQQIQQLGVNTLEELMNYVPGYQSYGSDQNLPTFASRSRRLTFANREVLVLLDGQRLNHDLLGSYMGGDGELALANVARVEFLRGPGSAIYGANAFLGVVNIISATGLNEASLSTASHQQQQAALNLSHSFDNGLQGSVFAQGLSDQGEPRSAFDPFSRQRIPDQPQRQQQTLYAQAHWGDWGLQARHRERSSENGYLLGTLGDGIHQRTDITRLIGLSYQHAFNSAWALASRVFYTPYDITQTQRISALPRLADSQIQGSETGMENRLTWQRGTANALLGLDYVGASVDKADLVFWSPPAPRGPAVIQYKIGSRHLYAAYAQWEASLSTNWTYILGLRQDAYSDDGSASTPRLGLIWQAMPSETFKLLYGQAFRAPAYNELYTQNNPLQIGNPNLKPEIAKTTELVWLHTSGYYYMTTSVFDTQITDPVVLANTPNPRSFIAGDPQHLQGIELETQLQLADHWQLRYQLTHMFSSALNPNNDALDTLSASLIYTNTPLTASVSARYHGPVQDADTSAQGYHNLASYTLLDAHLHYQLSPRWQVYANLRNLSNQDYTQPAVLNATNAFGVPGAGREWELGVKLQF